MNPVIMRTRRITNIKRDTTLPQYLHLPINAPRRQRANPLLIIGLFAGSVLTVFFIIAIIINLLSK